MTILLDANVLIALAVADHVHHQVVEAWFAERTDAFATCPITQGALLRLVVRNGASAAQGAEVLVGITASDHHHFWADEIGFDNVNLSGVVGHRQVTDAYLAGLARHRGGRLATLDRGLAAAHPDVAHLLNPDTTAR
ncbi:MAG: TA system VapC family ribonuclease toxin [Actinomycetota bacterium]